MNKNMKKNEGRHEERDSEILKAVAQAWHAHSISSKATTTTISESDAYRRFFTRKPTRFKLEATNGIRTRPHDQCWDFRQSLWDSYEIVSVSKKLETGLLMDDPFSALNGSTRRHSLRSLFNKMSSRRFYEDETS